MCEDHCRFKVWFMKLHPCPSLLSLAPCRAGNVAAHVDCDNNTAEITWSFASGADTYMVTALATNGHRATCQTEEDHCDLNNLQCGEAYMVSLTTIDENCQIETHTNVTFSTRELSSILYWSSWSQLNGSLIVNLFMIFEMCSRTFTLDPHSGWIFLRYVDTYLNMLSRAL